VKDDKQKSDWLDELRRRAEESLGKKKGKDITGVDALAWVHELHVHQTELEMQNEELKRARAEAEDALCKHTSLYDFAPVGYFTFDGHGTILEVNLTGASLLNIERSFLIKRRFQSFVEPDSQAAFNSFYKQVFETGIKQTCELKLMCPDKTTFYASLNGIAVGGCNENEKQCQTVIVNTTDRKQAEEKIKATTVRHKVVADLGLYALSGIDLSALTDKAVDVVAKTLDVEYCKVLELLPDGNAFLLRAGIGWKEGLVGCVTVPADKNSQGGYTLISNEPVIVKDLRTETRFSGPTLLSNHGVVSGMSVIIHGRQRPFGVLGAHTTRHQIFSKEDADFFQAVANVLAMAIERKHIEEQLRELSCAVEQSPTVVVITDADGVIQYVNPKFLQLTGYTPEEAIGKTPRILKSGKTPPEEYERLWHTIVSGNVWQGELTNQKKNGELYWENTCISPIKDSAGVITHFVAVKEDITERKRLEETIRQMAHYDTLTSLPNRALLNDRFNIALAHARRKKEAIAVMFIDLDLFKDINDTFGHNAGDLLLQDIAGRLLNCVRETDTVSRIGGDEFIILLPETGEAENVAKLAVKIIETIRHSLMVCGNKLSVTASIGIALLPNDGEDVETLMKHADIAMYRAKEKGRNRYQFYEDTT
jgi:diguanylate cyclase (GGDEF)-like protein/PAS domain S-box-containing protein